MDLNKVNERSKEMFIIPIGLILGSILIPLVIAIMSKDFVMERLELIGLLSSSLILTLAGLVLLSVALDMYNKK